MVDLYSEKAWKIVAGVEGITAYIVGLFIVISTVAGTGMEPRQAFGAVLLTSSAIFLAFAFDK